MASRRSCTPEEGDDSFTERRRERTSPDRVCRPSSTPDLQPRSHPAPAVSTTPTLLRNHSLVAAQPARSSDEEPSSNSNRPTTQHPPSRYRSCKSPFHPHPSTQPSRRPSLCSSSSSATLASAYSPPPYRKADYRYMATPGTNGLFKEYEPTSDDELPLHRTARTDSRNWQQHRPLIDNVTNQWRKSSTADDDDDDDFYYRDKQNWYTPALVTLIAAQRIPRRIQRAIFTVVLATILMAFSWKWFLGPYWTEQNSLSNALVGPQKWGYFGANARPAFTDMVHVKTLDPSLLPTSAADSQRLIMVGDVHGCKSELVELLNKINFRPAADHLVLTGDIIAKGPDSKGVVDFARDVHASCVRGNHEDRVLLSRKAMKVAEDDMNSNKQLSEDEARNGGNKKDKALAKKFDAKQIEWLEQCPVILKVGQIKGMGEVLVAHAGLVPGVDLERQDPFQVMNMRSLDLETKVPSAERDGTPWWKYWNYYMKFLPKDQRSTIIYGHDAKTGLKIKQYSKGLDSGCVRGGKLTALVIEADHKGGPAKQTLVHVKCGDYSSKEDGEEKKKR
ncbi:Bis(5'-nucleosyl)-tetraphosphatase [Lasiodiplodia hormozganensis]|uniref:Bis(5'-nucleosyl)-tetraphosphatase n=1 Tax=Lasiodiplodia hormozganensis TaxID=869390 RepID=A0AA40CQ01_9PEZI|nr:Bis(5'-nucleosyl)-tetraphosphatase [Lasiodiplodia hormozganensis]